jgi:hypothetical protein
MAGSDGFECDDEGALNELPNWQGKIENDWRDEQPSPWSLTAGVGDRIKDLMESLIP